MCNHHVQKAVKDFESEVIWLYHVAEAVIVIRLNGIFLEIMSANK